MRAAPLALLAILAPALGASEPVELPPLEVRASEAALAPSLAQSPASVTRVGPEAIAGGQYQVNLSESLARVPGLVVNNRHNYAQDLQISIRGFGARTPFGLRGIRLYTDGIPATMPDGQGQVSHFDLAGAEAITVLRGPFSALYGASSGGAIELDSREPSHPQFAASAWAGEDGLRRHGVAGDFVTRAWSGTGTAGRFDTDGFRDHSAATRLGGQVRVFGGESRDFVATANVLDLEAQDPLGLTRAQFDEDPRQAGANAEAYDTRKTVRQRQAGAAWTPQWGGAGSLRAVAWIGERDTRQFQSIPDTVQGTVASNPTHPGGVIDLDRLYYGADLRWIARTFGSARASLGLTVEALDERRQGFQNYTGTAGPASTKGVLGPRRRDEDNAAIGLDPYAQLDWDFAPGWSVLAGVRHARTRFESRDRFIIAGNGDDSGSASFRAWLPVAGVRHLAGPWTWRLGASRGAEIPTLNELAYRPDGSSGLNTELGASRSRNLESGLGWTRGGLAAELVAFRTDTRDEIVVGGSSGGRTTYRNASGTRRAGLESSLRADLGAGFGLELAGTCIEARYHPDFAGGNRLPGVPRRSGFAEVSWRRGGGLAAVEGLWRDAVSVNDAGSDAAAGYGVANARLSVQLPGGFELMARVDNVFDRLYAGSVIVNETNGRYFEPAPGRSAGLGLKWTSR